MNTKLTKALVKHYNIYFLIVKGLVNGFDFFLNDIFYQIFNINLNKFVWRISFNFLKIFSRIFQ